MPTKVFISYAHESSDLSDKVFQFSNSLRKSGINCEIDQYEESPPEGWPKWMMRQIQESEYVLVVCSDLFYRRANDFTGDSDGLGVKWETTLILQQLYSLNTKNTKYIPVIFESSSRSCIPLPLQPYTFYNISIDEDRKRLVDRLRGTLKNKKPPVDEQHEEFDIPLDLKERKSLFISSIIDIDLWNKAEWNGMFFVGDNERTKPPIIGFLFKNIEYGKEIFTDLKKQFGRIDKEDEIRICFIEEISKENVADYKVHIGSEWDVITKKMERIGMDPCKSFFMGITRIHEMNPPKGSKNLARFKSDYYYFNTYFVTNVIKVNGQIQPDFDNLIQKKKILFRKKSDIINNKNDQDYVCFSEDKET